VAFSALTNDSSCDSSEVRCGHSPHKGGCPPASRRGQPPQIAFTELQSSVVPCGLLPTGLRLSYFISHVRPSGHYESENWLFAPICRSYEKPTELAARSKLWAAMSAGWRAFPGGKAPDHDLGRGLIEFMWTLTGISAVVLGLRLFAVYHVLKRVRAADYLMVASFVRYARHALLILNVLTTSSGVSSSWWCADH
jgi:hypothetical protein